MSSSLLSRRLILIEAPRRCHSGYIPFSGRFDVRENDETRLHLHIKSLNLKPVSKIHFQFDPFRKEIRSLRDLMVFLSYPKVRNTNGKCVYKTDVLSDRSDPRISIKLQTGHKLVFNTKNLSTLEILFHINKFVLPLVKEEDESLKVVTKASKKMAGRRK